MTAFYPLNVVNVHHYERGREFLLATYDKLEAVWNQVCGITYVGKPSRLVAGKKWHQRNCRNYDTEVSQ